MTVITRTQRQRRCRLAVIGSLATGPKPAFDVSDETGYLPGTIYPILVELEAEGLVRATPVNGRTIYTWLPVRGLSEETEPESGDGFRASCRGDRYGVVQALWPRITVALEAARADERERLKAALRQIHWVTVYASGKFEGLPCCGCCAWLDGVRRPWPCDTLQAVGFTDDDIPAELRAVSDGN